MQCLGVRIALAPAGLRRAKPARQTRPLSRVAASASLETSKAPNTSKAPEATVADVEPVEADVNVLRAWRDQCPELRALWAGLHTLVPISAQPELTLPVSAQLKLTLSPILHMPQSNPWMCPEGAQVEL
jgi:hypothetical protein